MGYDCSVTNKKGCNYCMAYKAFYASADLELRINNETKGIDFYHRDCRNFKIDINYCPICGKKL
ncbi:hypothetical protein [Clostridium algidicarnis]|uniref:hypothetical protein n=1 Tax=Clostridium algidicarnis TaxID=37659 RepID=UPI001C0B85CE|nr:hypothetical protein [Clostridium algidicarnis]MBU3226781.1 hypothetical protein [Clostridium algidicarnis]MBU3250308.1 hypothetical protein [Clostridium algidicarnis]